LSECLAQEVKAFNVRVAVVEPGPIATRSLGKVQGAQPKTTYPQFRRLAALFAAATKQPTSPYMAGEQIRHIVESDSWQLRYPIGPHAPFAHPTGPVAHGTLGAGFAIRSRCRSAGVSGSGPASTSTIRSPIA
jgi:NAD(P)-dependent dehydrogenase (short-subunit alcohol dehydrogenase family)